MTRTRRPSVADLSRAVAQAVPAREAIVHRSLRRTYGELQDRVERLAGLLAARGLGAHRERAELQGHESGQDHLALYLHNGPEYPEANLAAFAARVAPFNVNYRYTAAELHKLLADGRPAAIVYHAAFAPTLAQVLGSLETEPLLLQVADDSGNPLLPGALDYEQSLATAPRDWPTPASDPDDLYVIYTGGTTGMPKGTLWGQHDIWRAVIGGAAFPANVTADQVGAAAAAGPGRRILGAAPFMHGAGGWQMLGTLLSGGLLAIPDVVHRLDAAGLCVLIERERLDSVALIGEAFARPVAEELERNSYDLSSVRAVTVGGGATSPGTKERLLAALGEQAVLADGAGSTETGRVIQGDLAPGEKAEPGVFTLLPRACVLDFARRRMLEPGEEEIGWLAARAPLPFGYLDDPAKSEATFPVVAGERVAVPGDLAQLRGDGKLVLRGREAMTINSGGEKIFAEEVERALLTHPAVGDVLVLGRPSERWGQEVVALVRLDEQADDEELRGRAAEQIARYKLPKAFVRVLEIRRSPAGKADYAWARSALAAVAEGKS
ncbi:AMP-binding protein [Peterkaempfera sp. SMS 1(5)a]|uniref:AMP-binding protein n=1 Tax=Peterkaempfera podocarpi TaxID=3232308 RepID=UPI00367128E1